MDSQPRSAGGGRRRSAAGRRASGGESTRERIVDAAQRLFAEGGYDATSTAKVAAAAAVPAGLVFYYFPTKRDLLMSVVRERAYQGSLPQAVAGAEPGDVADVLRRAARELAGILSRHRDTQTILFREGRAHPELQEQAAALVASSTGDLAGLLAGTPGVQAGAEATTAAARLLVASLLMDNFLQPEGVGPTGFEPAVRLLAAALSEHGTATAAASSATPSEDRDQP